MINYVTELIVWNLVIWYGISILPEGWLFCLVQINYFYYKRFFTISIINMILGVFTTILFVLFYIFSCLIIIRVFKIKKKYARSKKKVLVPRIVQ